MNKLDPRLEELIVKIKRYGFEDTAVIEKAFLFALKAHEGQKRLSGEDFINHPVAVANELCELKLDPTTIAAALLHDVVEDTPVTMEKIKKEFGQTIAELIDGVTKISNLHFESNQDEGFVENLRKLIVVMAKDLRVVLIKLADRYHNMQTLSVFPKEKQLRYSQQTMEVFAPLAERLGIGELKGRLEDLAFSYLEPEEYQWVLNNSKEYINKSDQYLNEVKKYLLKELAQRGIRADISARSKHLYSLHKKLNRSGIERDISKVHDLMATRIIVNKVEECYIALGIVHEHFKPVPLLGIRDFIAQPKPNGYRSIHTTVFALGKILEIQIRTEEMHEEAEYGIAAHWYYSQKKVNETSHQKVDEGFFAPVEKMNWVKELVRWQTEITDSKEFVDSLKFDALKHRIFIYSPKGEVFDLPAESTPVDFAYEVHGALGDQCVGAKVNGKIVPLNYKLQSGEIVEIMVNKNKIKPSKDWIQFVVTKKAKDKLKKVSF